MSGLSVPELLLIALLVVGFVIWVWALLVAVQRRSLLAFVLVFISGPIGACVYVFIVDTAPPQSAAPPPPPPPGPPPLT